MGVAGLIFEPCPPNFENQYNFWSSCCKNNVFFIQYLSYWRIYGHLKVKVKMGVTGLILSHALLILKINTTFENV